MSFKISKVTPDQFDPLLKISRETFDLAFRNQNDPKHFDDYLNKAFALPDFQKEFENPNSEFYFIMSVNQVCGYLKLNEKDAQTEPRGEGCLEIERIYVIGGWQGMGLGKIMIDFAVEIAKKKGKKVLWLGVWEKNPNAIRFYERLGFKVFGEHTFYMGDDPQRDLLMAMSVV